MEQSYRDDKIFVKVEKCIKMALVEMGTSTTITDAEITILHDLMDVFEPVKHAVDGTLEEKHYTAE